MILHNIIFLNMEFLSVRRVKESDMTKLAKATGGRISTNLDDISANDFGFR